MYTNKFCFQSYTSLIFILQLLEQELQMLFFTDTLEGETYYVEPTDTPSENYSLLK